MKLQFTLLAAVGLAATSTLPTLGALTIAEWTFEVSKPALNDSSTIGPILPEAGSGSASGFHTSAATDWSNPAGNDSPESWSVNTWAPGDNFLFQVATTGVADTLTITWDHTSSSTGPKNFELQYSSAGDLFTTALSYTVLSNSNVAEGPEARSAWSAGDGVGDDRQAIYTFSAVVPATPDVYLRVINVEEEASAAAGTSRLDNFNVSYTPVPEPDTYAVLAGAGLVVFALLRRRSTP